MVTGRLPFIGTRNETMTSQERRQKLLSQINRGLTSVHKKELTSLSAGITLAYLSRGLDSSKLFQTLRT